MTEEKTIIEYAGVGDIAQWCGVSQAAVSKWLERFPTRVPQPDAVIGRDSRRYPAYGWLPESRDRWILFAAGLRDGSVSGYVSPEAAEAEARAEQLAALRQYAQAQRAECKPDELTTATPSVLALTLNNRAACTPPARSRRSALPTPRAAAGTSPSTA